MFRYILFHINLVKIGFTQLHRINRRTNGMRVDGPPLFFFFSNYFTQNIPNIIISYEFLEMFLLLCSICFTFWTIIFSNIELRWNKLRWGFDVFNNKNSSICIWFWISIPMRICALFSIYFCSFVYLWVNTLLTIVEINYTNISGSWWKTISTNRKYLLCTIQFISFTTAVHNEFYSLLCDYCHHNNNVLLT